MLPRLAVAVCLVLAGCAVTTKTPLRVTRDTSDRALPWAIGGVYDTLNGRLTITADGSTVAEGTFGFLDTHLQLVGAYQGYTVTALCQKQKYDATHFGSTAVDCRVSVSENSRAGTVRTVQLGPEVDRSALDFSSPDSSATAIAFYDPATDHVTVTIDGQTVAEGDFPRSASQVELTGVLRKEKITATCVRQQLSPVGSEGVRCSVTGEETPGNAPQATATPAGTTAPAPTAPQPEMTQAASPSCSGPQCAATGPSAPGNAPQVTTARAGSNAVKTTIQPAATAPSAATTSAGTPLQSPAMATPAGTPSSGTPVQQSSMAAPAASPSAVAPVAQAAMATPAASPSVSAPVPQSAMAAPAGSTSASAPVQQAAIPTPAGSALASASAQRPLIATSIPPCTGPRCIDLGTETYHPAGDSAAAWTIAGQYDGLSSRVTLTVNGAPVARGRFGLLDLEIQIATNYEGHQISASCSKAHGGSLAESVVKCSVSVDQKHAASLGTTD